MSNPGPGECSDNLVVNATFHCHECSEVAAEIVFIPRGVDDARASRLPINHDRLVVSEFIGVVYAVVQSSSAEVVKALKDVDPFRLYEIDHEWAPFYCAHCRHSYCANHWRGLPSFEEGGWYDCTYGYCPSGHKRIIDD